MNERIRAHDLWTQVCQEDMPELDETYMTMRRTKKFAELIVRECANLFEIEYGTSEVSGNEVARVLQRHFGVEE